MTADPPGPGTWGDEASLGDVRESDHLVEALAARAPVGQPDDELVRLLAGWAAVVDAEAEAATRPVRRLPTTDPTAATSTSGVRAVRPVTPERPRRTPWWALSAGAAAVIAVMAVGLGVQDATQVGPVAVADSVESIEATLVAARLAAEQGDVVAARTLLERARDLVAELPADERAQFDAELGATEQGVAAVEEAVRLGEPLPAWPDSPRFPGTGDQRPGAPGTGPTATPGQPTTPGDLDSDDEGEPDGDRGDPDGTTPAVTPTTPDTGRTKTPKPGATTTAPTTAPVPTTTAPTTPAPTDPTPTPTRTDGPKAPPSEGQETDQPGKRPGDKGGGHPTRKADPPDGGAALDGAALDGAALDGAALDGAALDGALAQAAAPLVDPAAGP